MTDGLDLERLRRDVIDAGHDGLRVFADAVLERAKENIGVGDPSEDPDPLIALAEAGEITEYTGGLVISFDTAYAAKQHEDQRLQHPRGGGPKYLERALTELAPAAEAIIGSKVRARLASGLNRGRLSDDPNRLHR